MNLDLAKLNRDMEGVTRDGRRAVIYTVKADCKYPIHGYVSDVCCSPVAWTREGNFLNSPTESGWDLFNKPDANEEKQSDAVKADNSKEMRSMTKEEREARDDVIWKHFHDYKATPSESCEQPETFDWTVAMVLVGRGEKVQSLNGEKWENIVLNDHLIFVESGLYRRKPSPATPDYSLDQGFKEGDIIMVREMGENWEVSQYLKYCNEKRPYPHYTLGGRCGPWTFARPLTKSEYEKVGHE